MSSFISTADNLLHLYFSYPPFPRVLRIVEIPFIRNSSDAGSEDKDEGRGTDVLGEPQLGKPV